MNKSKKVSAPRDYLSWTQYSLFNRSPELYKRIYIYGEAGYCSKAMELGKKLAERMENEEEVEDKDIEQVAMFMPKSPAREYEIRIDFHGIPLFGKLDGFNPRAKKKIIREDKTGQKWNQKMVDKTEQLTFYAMMVLAKYGKLPDKIYLDWAKTRRNEDGELELTGEIKTFETKRTMNDILIFYAKIKRTWEGIQNMTKKEYAKIK
jgi:hypothetical protein